MDIVVGAIDRLMGRARGNLQPALHSKLKGLAANVHGQFARQDIEHSPSHLMAMTCLRRHSRHSLCQDQEILP